MIKLDLVNLGIIALVAIVSVYVWNFGMKKMNMTAMVA